MAALLLLHMTCVVLHVATAAAWFGLALRLGGQARAVVATEPAGAAALAADGARAVRQMGVFLVLTIGFALGAFFAHQGFDYGWPYYAGAGLMLVLVAVHFVLVAPGWRALSASVGDGVAGGARARARVAAGVGFGHLLWFTILVLMFWSKFEGALSVH